MTKYLIPLLIAVAASCVHADQGEDDFAAKLKAQYPNTKISEVKRSRVDGLFEVTMGSNVAYTDAAGRYFLFGHLFDMQQQVDLTAVKKTEPKRTIFPAAFLSNAIKTVKGDGSRTLAVFSDPDCGYCKQLEPELARLDNVTIYTFLFPLESLHPEAKTKSISIWCSQDRSAEWSKAILTAAMPKLKACANPINDNLTLGTRLGVVGTPTMIAVDGSVLPGAAPAERIEKWLASASTKRGEQ